VLLELLVVVLLLKQLRQPLDVEELEVLQHRHLGHTRPAAALALALGALHQTQHQQQQ
jgi:hypothetical protein